MPDVVFEKLTKRFGDFAAVDSIDLHIKEGEMITLLGPSGCGKTTTLRMLAGLESPDGGSISIGGNAMVDVAKHLEVPPEKRNLGMVFQSYAIWPHMTVFENVRYPLKVRGKLSKEEIGRRVDVALSQVGLDGFGSRSATLLSGGQQQRVALARAIVFEPTLLLLDEPLSNLDAKLRDQMRFELKEMQRRIGVTAIYVTHDQAEALTLSDRIVVMKAGVIEQVGTPEEIYGAPASRFVAGFIGKSNLVTEIADRDVSENSARFTISTFDGPHSILAVSEKTIPHDGVIAIRPEHIGVIRPGAEVKSKSSAELNYLPGKVSGVAYLGHSLEGVVQVGENIELRVILPSTEAWQNGDDVLLAISPSSVMVVR